MCTDNSIPGTDIPRPFLELVGIDGNAFSIIGAVTRVLKRAGAPKGVVSAFMEDAMSGDYGHVLTTAMRYTTDED